MAHTMTQPPMTRIYAARPRANAVLDIYWQANLSELDEGRSWYSTANALARRLDPAAPAQAAGVIAALSPMMNWDRNMKLAVRAYDDGYASGALFSNVAKADRILGGEDPLTVLGGKKVTNFFAAIADPTSPDAVCIDRHAFDIAVGRVTNDRTRAALARVGVYERFADAYRTAAVRLTRETGIFHTPAQVQAVTWVTWRRLKGLTD